MVYLFGASGIATFYFIFFLSCSFMEIVGGWIPEGGVFFVFCLLLLEHPVYCFWRFGSERRETFFFFLPCLC